MMKKILSILYILLISGLTYIMIPIFEVSGTSKFLADYKENFVESDYELISGTILAFRNNGTDAIILKQPLFKETYTHIENGNVVYKINLTFYSIVEKKGKKYNTGLFVIFDDIIINDPAVNNQIVLDEEGRNLIRFQMKFNESAQIGNTSISASEDVFIPLYEGNSGVLFFNQNYLKNESGFIEIEKINLSFRLKSDSYVNVLTLHSTNYSGEIEDDMFNVGNKIIDNISSSNIDILDGSTIKELILDDDNYYYNKGLTKIFRNKYNFTIYFIIIWVIIVFTITYFIFFHKHVMIKYREHKIRKKIEFEKLKEKIKLEEKE